MTDWQKIVGERRIRFVTGRAVVVRFSVGVNTVQVERVDVSALVVVDGRGARHRESWLLLSHD